MNERVVNDIIVLGLPRRLVPPRFDGIAYVDREQDLLLALELDRQANEAVQTRQDRPPDIEFSRVDWSMWTITDDPDRVAATPPPHDCDECREGLRIGVEALREQPGLVVAIGHLRYRARRKP